MQEITETQMSVKMQYNGGHRAKAPYLGIPPSVLLGQTLNAISDKKARDLVNQVSAQKQHNLGQSRGAILAVCRVGCTDN